MVHGSTHIGSPQGRTPFSLREARYDDTGAFMNVIAHADPHHPDPFGIARAVLASSPEPPLSHGRDLCLVAEDSTGLIVGAVIAGAPRWVFEHPGIDSTALEDRLVARLGMIHAVAVHPDHRRAGIGQAMIRYTEQRFAQAGYGIVTLNHDQDLDEFYRKLGYTVGDHLTVHLPGRRMIGMTTDDTRMSTKPLRPPARLADVTGVPGQVITGLLPGASLPARARFDGKRLRY